jgi:sporulation protein YlmC with PRC-barrel domain
LFRWKYWEGDVDLVRDLLDKKVVDRNGREMGRVDSVILDTTDGMLRVVAIELGPAVLARRLHVMLGRWAESLEHAFGVDAGRPLRIPMTTVLHINDSVRVDLAYGETPAATIEQRLRRWVRNIPGSS